ncbi:hypothetical protein GA0074695_1528 [Micromonospora viridifaciens]|uniref:Uncharacterized protein n=1 Tax=Micromonospora viridifaciens TaxID=1881 RepID=A0A1C4VJC5_MICVI|nr:hypothetical protein [Micromonospora viridifaciens]SCE84114.1 hypothetical protein GA0074695_1528 [Micromonospora viridifaciens]
MSRRTQLHIGPGRDAVAVEYEGRVWPLFRPDDPTDDGTSGGPIAQAASRYASELLPPGPARAGLMAAALRAWWAARPDTIPPFDPGPLVDAWGVEVRAILHTTRYYGAHGPNERARRLAAEVIAAYPHLLDPEPPPPPSEREQYGF